MVNQIEENPRGILNPQLGAQKFSLARYAPSSALAPLVEHYWIVEWDLRGHEPYRSETLPHPAVHLTVEPDVAHLIGVVTRKFSRLLVAQGWAFGIKFTPGGFYPFAQRRVATFTDKTVQLAELFGESGVCYAADLRAATNDAARVAIAEAFLAAFCFTPDDNVSLVNQIVATIGAERAITKVDQLVNHFAISKRGLQRLFSEYVGVSPKWVIQRYRLHEATAQVAAGVVIDWAKLATDLGYFDQAHFIKDFKALVGLTPAEYAKQLGEPPPAPDAG